MQIKAVIDTSERKSTLFVVYSRVKTAETVLKMQYAIYCISIFNFAEILRDATG